MNGFDFVDKRKAFSPLDNSSDICQLSLQSGNHFISEGRWEDIVRVCVELLNWFKRIFGVFQGARVGRTLIDEGLKSTILGLEVENLALDAVNFPLVLGWRSGGGQEIPKC